MSQRFRLRSTALDGVVVVERRPIVDERGWFERLFCARELESLTGGKPIVQINRSLTHRRGAVRGLHYQRPPHAEIKIVTCLRGEIFDVAVDLRAGSPTFLQWHGERLSAGDGRMLVVPEGCAHGFQALSDDANCSICIRPSMCLRLRLDCIPKIPGSQLLGPWRSRRSPLATACIR
jgi:dTDP-4-dehydrorhamnose 3,5-epimerase